MLGPLRQVRSSRPDRHPTLTSGRVRVCFKMRSQNGTARMGIRDGDAGTGSATERQIETSLANSLLTHVQVIEQNAFEGMSSFLIALKNSASYFLKKLKIQGPG